MCKEKNGKAIILSSTGNYMLEVKYSFWLDMGPPLIVSNKVLSENYVSFTETALKSGRNKVHFTFCSEC